MDAIPGERRFEGRPCVLQPHLVPRSLLGKRGVVPETFFPPRASIDSDAAARTGQGKRGRTPSILPHVARVIAASFPAAAESLIIIIVTAIVTAAKFWPTAEEKKEFQEKRGSRGSRGE